jgi:NAD(P)-dependent dehydrogenase (short-subunit alcohol dehydrogenase family)
MDLGLTDKIALVTGAGSQKGYGKAICLQLAQEGCHIVVNDFEREWEGAIITADEVKALGRRAIAVKADVRVREEVDNMVKVALEEFGQIDILVSNAGDASAFQPFLEMTRETWDFDIQTNLYGQLNMVQAVAPHMVERKYGKILVFTGGRGIPGNSMYSAAKGGIITWANSVAKELGPYGVYLNVLMPGVGATNLGAGGRGENFRNRNDQAAATISPFMESIKKRSLHGRLCEPADMGRVVAFLVSDANSYWANQLFSLAQPV